MSTGQAGDDLIDGGTGDDLIDGGDGNDQASYQGNQDDYKITFDAGSNLWRIEDVNDSDDLDEGIDSVANVETLIFADGEKSTNDGKIINPGHNIIEGTAGADKFAFALGSSGIDVGNRDIINNFEQGLDLIDLSQLPGLTFINDADLNAINQVRYQFDGPTENTVVQINLDNDVDTVEMEIQLTGLYILRGADFILRSADVLL